MRYLFASALVVLPLSQVLGEEARRPNIVFILADDLGYTDLACYGSQFYETPNIDRLAAEGVRFTDGYTCGPNCQPTRAALLSGQYGPKTGVYTVGGIDRFDWRSRPLRPVDNVTALPLDKVTIADALKKAGSASGIWGTTPHIILAPAGSTKQLRPRGSILIFAPIRPSNIRMVNIWQIFSPIVRSISSSGTKRSPSFCIYRISACIRRTRRRKS
jgi:hypothetical protein